MYLASNNNKNEKNAIDLRQQKNIGNRGALQEKNLFATNTG